jgi:hypothetical protein
MKICFYVAPEKGELPINLHSLREEEVEDVLSASRWRPTAAGGVESEGEQFSPGLGRGAGPAGPAQSEAAAEGEAAFEDRGAIREIAEDEKRQKAIRVVGLGNAGRRAWTTPHCRPVQ